MLGRKKKQSQTVVSRRPVSRSMPSSASQNRAFSYYANRSTDITNVGRTSTAVEERTDRRSTMRSMIRHMPIIIASIVIAACVLSEFMLSSSPKIVVLGSDSSSNVFLQNTAVYQKAAAALFSKSVENRNKVTVNVSAITASLKRMFPELEDVSVALPIVGHRPVVYIEPSQPSLALVSSTGTFLLDENGNALAQVDTVSQLVTMHVSIVTDQSGLRPKIGEIVLSSTDVSFIQTVLGELNAQHIGVQSIVLPAAADEVDVYIAGHSLYGKFNMQEQGDALEQVGTFIAVYQDLAAKNELPSHYIDVRVDGRAYYK